ncbi:thiopeptide maturation pyridine synthase [Saccharopolyspora shandongensis]|uniref:thiopeptide maturation pyridine synthase n=1 Tax=Saccharopolyspora shandongensis TaxID=418495 RepID=UPI00341A1FA6
MADVEWHSLHVHYHDSGGHDRLLLNAVRPLFERLSRSVDEHYFMQHWRQGAHLRLNFRCPAETFEGVVVPTTHRIIGDYLAAHPSTSDDDPEELLPLHRDIAEREDEPGPLLPWYPDNSVRVADYDEQRAGHPSRASSDLVAEFYAASNEHAIDLIERIQGGTTSPAGLAFDLLVATVHGLADWGIPVTFLSFRSHADSFLGGDPNGAQLRAQWETHFDRHAESLAERVRQLVSRLDGAGPPPDHVVDWMTLMQPVRLSAARHVAAGHRMLPGEEQEHEPSDYHRALHEMPAWRRIRDSDEFVVYRLMLNYAFLHLTRIGVRPIDRYMLCHLLANSVERAYGLSAYQAVGL